MWKVRSCCREKKSKIQEEVLARHIKERVNEKKIGNKEKTLECNHFDDEDTIMSFLMLIGLLLQITAELLQLYCNMENS